MFSLCSLRLPESEDWHLSSVSEDSYATSPVLAPSRIPISCALSALCLLNLRLACVASAWSVQLNNYFISCV